MSTSPPPIGYIFHCRKYGKPIALQAETLARPFEPQGLHTKRSDSVGVVCPHCKRIENYSLVETSPDYDPTGHAELVPRTVKTEFLGWYGCDKQDCGIPILLASPATATMTYEELSDEIATWIWDDFHCYQGHKIDPKISFECLTPDCKRVFEFRMSDMTVGLKVSCLKCALDYTLTAEQIKRIKAASFFGKHS